jgi:hypothetical protein
MFFLKKHNRIHAMPIRFCIISKLIDQKMGGKAQDPKLFILESLKNQEFMDSCTELIFISQDLIQIINMTSKILQQFPGKLKCVPIGADFQI